jgi:YD repeat-containing protein
LDQDRTHNKVNETTAITATVGDDWTDPVHDRSGNMTTLPKPSSPTDGLACQYDPWNRLVEVTDGETAVGKYEYDALNRRVKKHLDSQSPASPNGIDTYVHYFYNAAWQVLETRETDTEAARAETLQPKYQHVWSPRYIDVPILRDENTDEDNVCDDARLHYLGDANLNVTSIVDINTDAVERYEHAPYGMATIHDGEWSNSRSTSAFANNVLYTGREYDWETRLCLKTPIARRIAGIAG